MTKNFETLRSDLAGALAATEAAKHAAIERLKAEILQSEKTAASRAKELEAEFQQELSKRKAAIVARIPGALSAPVASFIKEDTRAAAAVVIAAWRSLDTDALGQTGCRIGVHHLIVALAKAKGFTPSAERLFDGACPPINDAASVIKSADPASARSRLLTLEGSVATFCGMYPAGSPAYLEVVEGSLSDGDLCVAVERFHRDLEVEARKRLVPARKETQIDATHFDRGGPGLDPTPTGQIARDFVEAYGGKTGWRYSGPQQ
ncbi:MAG TPA: hypothetical protein VG937_28300 [Polyangiaceae bacterium]|nr:hypothetical protein [Polyangiaceae bacterium]